MKSVFFIYSILILKNPYPSPYYYVFTNSGLSVFTSYDELPKLCRQFLLDHSSNALTIPSEPPIAIIPLHKYI